MKIKNGLATVKMTESEVTKKVYMSKVNAEGATIGPSLKREESARVHDRMGRKENERILTCNRKCKAGVNGDSSAMAIP